MKKGKLTNAQSLKIAKKTAKQRARHRAYLKKKHILRAQQAQKAKRDMLERERPLPEIQKPQKKKVGLWYNIINKVKSLWLWQK